MGKKNKTQLLNPKVSGCGRSCCREGQGKITTNQYKVVLSGHCYPLIKHFCTKAVVSSSVIMPPISRAQEFAK